jgi:hypothetical protein
MYFDYRWLLGSTVSLVLTMSQQQFSAIQFTTKSNIFVFFLSHHLHPPLRRNRAKMLIGLGIVCLRVQLT